MNESESTARDDAVRLIRSSQGRSVVRAAHSAVLAAELCRHCVRTYQTDDGDSLYEGLWGDEETGHWAVRLGHVA